MPMTSIQTQRRVAPGFSNPLHFRAPRSRPESLAPPRNLSELIQGLHYIFEDDHIDVDAVKKYMASYKSVKSDWLANANFDKYRYTRNLIDEGNGKFNLILLCWGGGHKSSIHDHSDSHCFMKIMEGGLREILYDWPSESRPMSPKQTTDYNCDEVAYINDSLGLHRVQNISPSENAVSLHLYSPPFQMCQTFNENDGHKVKCNVTFFSKYGRTESSCCVDQYDTNDTKDAQPS